MADLIPFGKHRGKPVDALLDDRQYMDWLLAQGWFKEKYGNIYQIVINNGQEPSETPEHNAMQIKFLDETYRIKFAYVAMNHSITRYGVLANLEAKLRPLLLSCRTAYAEYEKALSDWRAQWKPIEEVPPDSLNTNVQADWAREWDMYKARLSEWVARGQIEPRPTPPLTAIGAEKSPSEDLPATIAGISKLIWMSAGGYGDDSPCNLIGADEPAFEDEGVDVAYNVEAGISPLAYSSSKDENVQTAQFQITASCREAPNGRGGWLNRERLNFSQSIAIPKLSFKRRVTIEIKPAIGDDYPAVLRQIKRNNADFVLVGQYHGVGATREQFVQFFATQNKTVIFENDVENADIDFSLCNLDGWEWPEFPVL